MADLSKRDAELLAEECEKRGLPVSMGALMRHIEGSYAAVVGAKDYHIDLLSQRLGPADMLSVEDNLDEAQRHLGEALRLMRDRSNEHLIRLIEGASVMVKLTTEKVKETSETHP